MSIQDAENEAGNALNIARLSSNTAKDAEVKELARAVEMLANAVQNLARATQYELSLKKNAP